MKKVIIAVVVTIILVAGVGFAQQFSTQPKNNSKTCRGMMSSMMDAGVKATTLNQQSDAAIQSAPDATSGEANNCAAMMKDSEQCLAMMKEPEKCQKMMEQMSPEQCQTMMKDSAQCKTMMKQMMN